MSKNEFISLIHKYLTGECTLGEIDRVEKWVKSSPENKKAFEAIKRIWEVEPEREIYADLGKAWEQLEQKMGAQGGHRPAKVYRKIYPAASRKRKSAWLRIAAVLVLGAMLSLFALYFSDGFYGDRNIAAQEEVTMQEIHTDRAHQTRMTFSDGTQVRLNAASLLRFPSRFTSDVRQVYLEGEAWFDVAHNPDVIFIVQTPDAKVEVLGTEFNVKAYSDDPGVEVVVADGLVSVKSADEEATDEVLLKKGEMSRVPRGEAPGPARQVDIASHISWLRGSFVFEETPFARVVAEWERRFDLDFEVENKALLETPFTGEFRSESFDEMLRLTSLTLDFTYERTNNTITIYHN